MRTFGIEIECYGNGTDMQAMARALAAAGVPCAVTGYTHNVMNAWKIVPDGSLVSGRNAMEVVSPVLPVNEDSFAVLRTVARVLTEQGATVKADCGFHVHIAMPEATVGTIGNLVRWFLRNETVMDAMMPASRRGSSNRYCRSVRTMVECAGMSLNDALARFNARWANETSVRRMVGDFSRYFKLNLTAWLRYGTVEFRQHAGTTSAAKMVAWVKFCAAVVDGAVAGTLPAVKGSKARVLALAPDAESRATLAERFTKFDGQVVAEDAEAVA